MKRKQVWIALLAVVPAALCAFGLAACGEGKEQTPPPYTGQHGGPAGPGEGAPPAEDTVVLDGKLGEADWESVEWGEWTTKGTSGDELGSTEVNVRAATVYGLKGVYIAFDVSHTPVYVDPMHTRELLYDSAISPYIGIPGTSLNYESYITADGAIGVKTYTNGNFMDSDLEGYRCATTIKNGEVNTPEADGYIIEAYLPWSAFRLNAAPAAIYMDIAVITSESSEATGRAGWESLGKSYKAGWGWATPNSYWYWGNGGFERSALTVKVEEYDEASGTVTLSKTEYAAFDDIEIDLTPADGYLLSSVKLNGEEMRDLVKGGKLILENYCGAAELVISAKFGHVAADSVTLTGTVRGYAGASEDWALRAGTTIVFAGELVYEAETDADGNYSVTLATGEYTVSAEGFAAQKLNVTAGGTKDLRLRYKLFESSGVWSIEEDESSATPLGNGAKTLAHFSEEYFVLTYRVRGEEGVVPSNANYKDGVGLIIDGTFSGEKDRGFQFGYIDNGFALRITGEWSGAYELPVTAEKVGSDGVWVQILRYGNKVRGYYRLNKQNGWTAAGNELTLPGNAVFSLFAWQPGLVLDDISYCDGEDPVKYTVGGKVTVDGGACGNWLLPAGTKLTFTGPTVTTATLGADGTYSAQLSHGTYSVTAEGCESYTLTVTGAATKDLSVKWKLLADTNLFKEEGGAIRPVIQNAFVGINFLSDKFVLRYRVSPQAEKTIADIGYIYVRGKVGETTYDFSLYDYDTKGTSGHQLFADVKEGGKMMAGSQASITNGLKLIAIDEFNQNGIELMLVRDGTTFDFYVQDAEGVWHKVYTLTGKAIENWQLLCTQTAAEIKDISYADGLEGLNIVLDADVTNGSVEFEGSHKLGEDVVLKFTATENCVLKSVLVDGVDKTASVQDGKLTVEGYMRLTMNVEATFEEHVETYEVVGSATASAGASKAWNIPDGTELSFTNSKQIVTKATVTGGRYTAQLAVGSYTVTADGYSTVTVEIAGAETEDIVLRYALLGSVDVWTVGENDTSAKASVKSDGGKWLPIHTGRGTFTLIYRVKGVEGAAATNDAMTDGAGYFVEGTYPGKDGPEYTSRGYQFGYLAEPDNNWAFRMSNEWSGNYGLSLTADHFAHDGVWVMLVCENGTIKAYYKLNAADAWTKSNINDLALPQDAVPTLYTWNANVCFDNISYEPYLPEVVVEATVKSEHDTGSLTVEPLRYGGTLKVTASPAEGYQLTSLKVNGTEHIGDVKDGTSYTAENFREFAVTVEATFAPIPEETFTVSGKATAVAGASAAWDLPAGTSLTFTGESAGQATVGAEGAYTVELAAGSYTVSAEHLSGTLTVEGEASDKNIQLRWDLFGTSEYWTVSEENGTASASENWKEVTLNLPKSDFVLKYRVKGGSGVEASDSNFADGTGISVYGSFSGDGSRGYQCGFIDGGYALRMTNEWSGSHKLPITAEEFASDGISVLLVRKGTTLKSYYLLGSSDQWNVCAINELTLPDDVRYTVYTWNKDIVIADMEYAPGDFLLNVKLDINDAANGSVKAGKDRYTLGETVELTVKPVEGYELTHLYVNDVDMASSVKENKLTLTDNMKFELRIRAEFVQPQSVQISGAVKAVAGASDAWNVPDGTTLTFTKGGAQGTTAEVSGGGTYSVELLTGAYTVTAEGYLPLSLDITSGGTEKDLTLRWDLIAESDKYEIAEDDSSAIAADAVSTVDIHLQEGNFVLFATIGTKTGTLETNASTYRSIRFVNGENEAANNITVNFFRFYNSGAGTSLSFAKMTKNGFATEANDQMKQKSLAAILPDTVFAQNGMKTMSVLKDGKFSFYIMTNANEWLKISEVEEGTTFTKAQLACSNCSNRKYTDISYYPGTEKFDELGLEG